MNKPNLPAVEKRVFTAKSLRSESQGAEMALVGCAASFNVLSQDLGGFREIINPGAFALSLAAPDSDVRCLVNHDANMLLGRQKNGTLKVWEDATGLQFRCVLDPNNSAHKNAYASIKRGDMDQCSFAFTVPNGGDDFDEDQDSATGKSFIKRTLRNVNLLDVSSVTYPAYSAPGATQVNARQVDEDQRRSARVAAIAKQLLGDQLADLAEVVAADQRDMTATDCGSMSDWMSARLQKAMDTKGYKLLDWDDDTCVGLPSGGDDVDLSDEDNLKFAARWNYQIDPSGNVVLTAWRLQPYQLDEEGTPVMSQSTLARYRLAVAEIRDDRLLRKRMREAAGIFHS